MRQLTPLPSRATDEMPAVYRDLVEYSPEAAYVVADGLVVYLNPAAVRLFGADSPERLLGTDILDRIHPDDHGLALARRKMVLETGVPAPVVEMRFVALDGRIFEVEVQATRIAFAGSHATYAAARDISARKRLEEEVRASQKLEAVGRLAGGIAHDFNNTLAVILGHCDLLLAQVADDSEMREELQAIHRAAQHSATLTRQLLTYARRQAITPRPLDLNEATTAALRMLRPLLGEHIRLDWQPGSELWPVVLDPSQLDQILTNLCANARDAIGDASRGQITIATGNLEVTAEQARTTRDLVPGPYVRLSCADSGHGIPPEILDQIFEPFFTTKPLGEGTGLGLSTIYGIVRQNHGALTVQSTPGEGTRFDIFIPRHHPASPDTRVDMSTVQTSLEAGPRLVRAGSETILVVEDEPAVLQLTSRALRAQGYTVLTADGPDAALQVLAAHPEPIDLLLTDVMMPVMTGPELARIVVAQRRETRVLYMSGYSADLVATHGRLNTDTEVLAKPFTIDDLKNQVRRSLDRASNG